jgi:hypothetical protein
MDKMNELVFADDGSDNWLYKKYYYNGANSRYWSFQIALNLLIQRVLEPVIIETGCQRQEDDLGAGMSTSLFGEFCQRYNGRLFTVDLVQANLDICKTCTKEYVDVIKYICSDSVTWLRDTGGIEADLLYLDSWDHPYGEILNCYGGQNDLQKAIDTVNTMNQSEILAAHADLLNPCQEHCLNEFLAAESSGKVTPRTMVLIDDNQLPGGGKSRLAKAHLAATGWICLFDLQQSLWVKEI